MQACRPSDAAVDVQIETLPKIAIYLWQKRLPYMIHNSNVSGVLGYLVGSGLHG